MKTLLFIFSFILLTSVSSFNNTARAGGGGSAACGGCATEITQLLNHAELLLQLTDMYEQAVSAFESNPLQPEDYLEQLAATLQQADQVSYMVEDVAGAFDTQLPTFDEIAAYGPEQYTPQAINARFKQWRDETRDQLKATFCLLYTSPSPRDA